MALVKLKKMRKSANAGKAVNRGKTTKKVKPLNGTPRKAAPKKSKEQQMEEVFENAQAYTSKLIKKGIKFKPFVRP